MTARDTLAQRQAALLAALLAGADPPERFDAEQIAIQAAALRAKRRNVISRHRPDVADALGERFADLCDAYMVSHPRRVDMPARRDADEFAGWLAEQNELRRPPRFRMPWQR